jgi:hypothetical protein
VLLAAGASLDPRDSDGTALDNAIKQRSLGLGLGLGRAPVEELTPTLTPTLALALTRRAPVEELTLTQILTPTPALALTRRAAVEDLLEAAHTQRRVKAAVGYSSQY